MCLSSAFVSCRLSQMLQGFSLRWVCGFFCYGGYMYSLVGLIGPQPIWLSDPALSKCCWLLFSKTAQGLVTRQLATEPQGASRLVLAHWWQKPGPEDSGLLLDHWLLKPDPVVSAGLLVGRASSWSPIIGPGIPELVSGSWWQGWAGWFLDLVMESEMS